MANPVWPVSLPQTQLLGATAALADTVLRTAMDVGPAKQRRRQTAAARAQSVPVQLTDAQRATLDTFFTTTLEDGALVFDYVNIETEAVAEFRFRAPPVFTSFAPGWWRAVLALELMP